MRFTRASLRVAVRAGAPSRPAAKAAREHLYSLPPSSWANAGGGSWSALPALPTTRSDFGRKLTAFGLLVLLSLALASCSQPLDIRNAAPRVSAISAATPEADGLRIVFWLQDHEQDAVDIEIAYAEGPACDSLRQRITEGAPPITGEAALKPVTLVPGQGQGVVGLTSDRELPGRVHELVWDTSAVADGDICLYILPDDREGDLGDPAVSQTFRLSAGF